MSESTTAKKELVKMEISEEFGILTLDKPPVNELSFDLFTELKEKFSQLRDNSAVQSIIFTAKGSIVFSAGADVKEIYQLAVSDDRKKGEEALSGLHAFFLSVEKCKKKTAIAVNGFCFGGGFELALACQYRIASKNAVFALPEVGLGIIPGLGGTQRLPRLIGGKAALEILFSGLDKKVNARTAKNIGLVDELAGDQLLSSAKNFLRTVNVDRNTFSKITQEDVLKCSELAKGKPNSSVNAIVEAVNEGAKFPIDEALILEQRIFLDLLFGEDAKEGLRAFLTKRKANFPSGVIGQENRPIQAPVLVNENTGPSCSALKQEEKKIWAPFWESEDCQSLRELARDFADTKINPKIAQMEKERRILPELVSEMAKMGFYGVPFPEKYGGIGLGKTGFCILMEELSYCHGSTSVFVGAHVSLAAATVYLFGNEDQKQRYLVPAIKGEKIGAYATTEPNIGSDIAGIQSLAKKVAGGWRIDGNKQFISNGAVADFIIVFVKTDEFGGHNGLSAFIVDTKTSGFEITKVTEEKIGLHASCTSSFAMSDIFVPDENLLGQAGQGFKIAMNVFNQSRISLGAGCIGAVRAALDEALKFAKDRQVFGEALYMKQGIQNYLARIETIRYQLATLVYQTAALYETGRDVRKDAAIVKYVSAELLD